MWRRSSKKVIVSRVVGWDEAFSKKLEGVERVDWFSTDGSSHISDGLRALRAGLLNQNRRDGTSTETPRVFSRPPRTFQASRTPGSAPYGFNAR
jgi:hypothetical protein